MGTLLEGGRMHGFTQTQLEDLIENKRWLELRTRLDELHPQDVSEMFSEISLEELGVVFRLLRREHAADVFAHLSAERQEALIEALSGEKLQSILNELSPDDRTRLLEEMPAEVSQKLLGTLGPEQLKHAKTLLAYPEESVGRAMTTNYVWVPAGLTAQEALEHIRKNADGKETLNIIYVADKEGKLIADIRLGSLLLADPEMKVEEIDDRPLVSLNASLDQEEGLRIFEKYDRMALPVVDSLGHMLGIITHDDMSDVAKEEATEDIHKAGGMLPLPLSYREASIWALFQKRVGWLVILVGVSLVSSGVIEAYEETLAAVLTLAFFIPLLIDSGGNTGSQSATLMVRALATGDVELRHWWRVLLKELSVGITLGVAMGVASGALGIFRGGWEIGAIVGLSMICIVIMANLLGVLLPFILTRLRLDPAVASSPLITTVVDASGLIIYFSIATWFLQRSLVVM